jgi:nitroreductase
MEAFKTLIQNRRSHRRFTDEHVSPENIHKILRAALMSPTSKSQRSWRFVVVEDKAEIEKISNAKETGSQFLKDAPLVILVLGNPSVNDCWIEDCSIAAFAMQLQAEDLGLGSCWVQFRNRGFGDGRKSDDVIRRTISIPDGYEVLCALAIGTKADERKPQDESKLKWENVINIQDKL